jgi:hypothetical protein
MKRAWIAILLGLGLLALPACRRYDHQTVAIAVPGLRGETCLDPIRTELRLLLQDGSIVSLAPDYTGEILTITFDSMRIARKNLEHAIADAGFPANDIPADPKARDELTSDCK